MSVPTENIKVLDLHWTEDDPDFGIRASGVFCKDIEELSRHIEKVKNSVLKINLDSQPALKSIPYVLDECKLLQELDISHTDITEIPDFLFTLPNLRSLSCCCRKLTMFPRGLLKAQKLEKLHIRINEDWTFPNEIIALSELKILILDLYAAIPLPQTLGKLSKLEELTINIKYKEGNVPDFLASFSGHTALKKFTVFSLNNGINLDFGKTASVLATCPALELLLLSRLKIGKHQGLAGLKGLKKLELRHLDVEGNVFESIKNLSKLENLEIHGSEFKITIVPDIFDGLPELQVFSFAGNIVRYLPPSIYNLSKLKNFEVGSSGLLALEAKIGNLKNLERLHLYDNLLEKIPDEVFTLPRLQVLDIEDNIFKSSDLAAMKLKTDALEKNGQKIEFLSGGQGRRQMVKKLRTLRNPAEMEMSQYFKYCFDALTENPFAIKYVNKDKFKGTRHYAELCIMAARKNSFTLELIDPAYMEKSHYFFLCIEAAKSNDIGHSFKFIKTDLLSDYDFIQVCIEAALHNSNRDFLNYINASAERLGRSNYERICWVAILHNPSVISKMIEPTDELRSLAEKLGYKL